MGFKTPPNSALQCGPGWREEQTETDDIGHNPRSNQEQSGPENKRGIDELSGWCNPVVEVFLHLPQRPPAFQPGQVRSNNARTDNQEDRQADSKDTADLKEQIQLRERNNGEQYEKSKEHGFHNNGVKPVRSDERQ